MADDTLIAVTAATGGLGGRVAHRLAAAGAVQRLVVRDPDRAPVLPGAEVVPARYDDPGTVRAALAGVDTLLFVSATEHPDRIGLHRGAIDAAIEAGVRRIVYTSFLAAAADATFTFARDHWHTEQHIRATGIPFTFLRNSLYQDVLPHFVGGDGAIRGPAGRGRFAPVARDDIADVAAAVLLNPAHAGHTYDLTGPAAITMAEVAEVLTSATGRPVRYHAETLDEAYGSRSHFDAPRWEVDGWVTTYAAIAAGELAAVTDTVSAVTGHPPMGFAQFLAANPETLTHLHR
jgi:NAD(P)H dehydrogenase (quinone)